MNNEKLIHSVLTRCIHANSDDILIRLVDDNNHIIAHTGVYGSPLNIKNTVSKYVNTLKYLNFIKNKKNIEEANKLFPATTISDAKELVGANLNFRGVKLSLEISVDIDSTTFPDQ